ncbi:MAG: 50S ribosomal protein L22 [Firmicutes bacterium]|nr:50S ribosomal protein L22 [Bacillota bacterium]
MAKKTAKAESAQATARFVRLSPTKVNLVLDLVRGKPADEALAILRFSPRRAARTVAKVLRSAVANAENNYDMDRKSLYVAEAQVGAGPVLKRWHPRMRGQAFPILRRTCHIRVVVREREGE